MISTMTDLRGGAPLSDPSRLIFSSYISYNAVWIRYAFVECRASNQRFRLKAGRDSVGT